MFELQLSLCGQSRKAERCQRLLREQRELLLVHTYSAPAQSGWHWHAMVGAPFMSTPVLTAVPCMHV